MNKKGLTMSLVFEAQSANYGEGMGNIASLKQLSRGDGSSYTYISRQALRYSIIKQLCWDNTPVKAEGSGDKMVIQFTPDASIKDYPEIDLFGYMKTRKGQKGGALTRNAVVRLSHAISLESYKADMEFLNNMGLAKRIDANSNLAQMENHKSFYAYTITIDLDRVGIETDFEGNVLEEIPNSEKAKRVSDFLNTVKLLYRDIRGRRENLNPVFVIGGLYEKKNPYFEDRIKLNRNYLDIDKLCDAIKIDQDAEVNTKIGYHTGTFANDKEIKERFNPVSIGEFFDNIIKEVQAFYG